MEILDILKFTNPLGPGNNNRHDIPMDVHSWYLIQAPTVNKEFHKLRKKKEVRPRYVTMIVDLSIYFTMIYPFK